MTNASEKQINFIHKLVQERNVPEHLMRELQLRDDDMTSTEASNIITDLLSSPLKVLSDPVTQPGMYVKAGEMFRVQVSRQSGRLYAMQLVLNEEDSDKPYHFEYAAGAIRVLQASNRMSLEQAKEFGLETGFCCVCGAFLTDPKSVEAGIGPICAKKV